MVLIRGDRVKGNPDVKDTWISKDFKGVVLDQPSWAYVNVKITEGYASVGEHQYDVGHTYLISVSNIVLDEESENFKIWF